MVVERMIFIMTRMKKLHVDHVTSGGCIMNLIRSICADTDPVYQIRAFMHHHHHHFFLNLNYFLIYIVLTLYS